MTAQQHEVDAAGPRSVRMEQRTTPEAKETIERAARTLGMTPSEFIVSSAVRAARDTLRDLEVTVLKPEAHAAFKAALEATEPTPALVELMSLTAGRSDTAPAW